MWIPRLKFIITLLVTFSLKSSFAQQLTLFGHVHNQEQKPLSYVTITLTTLDSIEVKQTLTDTKGYFSINAPKGNFQLVLSQFGKELHRESITLNTDRHLSPIEVYDIYALKGVTVNANRPFIKTVGDKLFFNIENSPLAKGNNGIELLKKSPKISMGADGHLLLMNKSVLVMINGRKINLDGKQLEDYLSGISSEDIKRIEIQDLASSDQEATTAGGIVNIILKKPQSGFRGIAKSYYQYKNKNYDRYGGGVNLNFGTDKWNAYSDISYTKNEDLGITRSDFDYFDGRKNHELGRFSQNYKSLGIRSGVIYYPNKKNEIGIEGYFNENKMDILLSGALDVYKSPEEGQHSINKSQSKTTNDLWYLTFNYSLATDTIGSSFKIITDLGRNSANPFNDVLTIYPSIASLDNHYLFDTHASSFYYTTQADMIQKFSTDWELNGGVKIMHINRDNSLNVKFLQEEKWNDDEAQKQNFDNRENTLTGHASLSKKIGRHFFKAGLRVENTSIKGLNKINENNITQNYTKAFPALYYRYNISNQKSINLSYKRSISRPSFVDLNPFVLKINDYLFHIGNPGLQPQFIDRLDIGYSFPKHFISLYGVKINEIIQKVYFMNENSINYYQAQNFGNYKSMGVDHSYTDNLFKWLYLSLSSGIYYNTFSDNNNREFSGASFYNNSYLQFKLYKKYLLELTSNYQHSYSDVNIKSRYKYQFDISASKSFIKESLLVKVMAVDLFNTKFDENTSFFPDFNFNFYQKRLTRGVFLQIQYTLDNKRKVKKGMVKSENESRGRL
ncbi:outer membrane beta-barrel family protein [Pedobacter cryoconitis]|uniref:outer membrane beta-barrel family protein n=1 Tax=Pedobacter cryoconitis TaxID=188932 RepID=UPI00160C6D61|nr:outer membrane beta-barrel family protein [Pedobacter cryoconitis]MBB5648191.1 hypothetical protein [Pedobacter cryoconitis]